MKQRHTVVRLLGAAQIARSVVEGKANVNVSKNVVHVHVNIRIV